MDEQIPEIYERIPRTLYEAFGPYARLTTEEELHDFKADKRYAFYAAILLVALVAAVVYFKR